MALKISGSTIVDDSRQIINAAKVGIGSLNPTVELDIFATDPKISLTREFASTSANAGSITFGNGNWDSSIAAIEGFHDGHNLAGGLRFLTQDSANNGGGDTVERLRIDSSGNVGINSSTPGSQLVVQATTDDNPALTLYRQSTGGDIASIGWETDNGSQAKINYRGAAGANAGMQFYTAGGSSSELRMIIDHSGNIGIGTNNPLSLLDVWGANGAGQIRLIETNHTNGNRYGKVFEYAGNLYFQSRNDSSDGGFVFRGEDNSDTVEFLHIDSSGRVMIGNNQAANMLDAASNLVVGGGGGSEGITIYGGASDGGFIAFADGTSDPAYRMGQIIYDHGSDAMSFRVNGNTERLGITSEGYVQIKYAGSATTGGAPLYVGVQGKSSIDYAGGDDDTACLRIEDELGNDNYYHGLELRTKNSGDVRIYAHDRGSNLADLVIATDNGGIEERMRITSTGNVGIGTDPDSIFSVKDTYIFSCAGGNSTTGMQIGGYDAGANSYSPISIRASQILFNISGTERLRITSDGKVGIGITNPEIFDAAANHLVIQDSGNCGLTIDSTSGTKSSIYFADGADGNEAYRGWVQYTNSDGTNSDYLTLGTAAEERLRIDSSGNLTIPTTDAKIQLKDGNSYIQFVDADKDFKFVNAWNAGEFTFNLDGAERLRITSGGDVGIGTDNPTQESGKGLHIANTTANAQARIHLTTEHSGHTINDGFYIVAQGDESIGFEGDVLFQNKENKAIKFSTNNIEKLRITNDGHLIPFAGSTYNIGASGTTFANGYFDTIHATNISGTIGSPGSDKEILFNNSGTIAGSSNFTWDTSNNDFNVSGNTIFGGAGGDTATDPLVRLNNSSSDSFNHSLQIMTANLAAGETNVVAIGKETNDLDSAYIGYRWYATDDTRNILTFGHWGSGNNYLMNLDGNGNLGIGVTNPSGFLADANRLVVGNGSDDQGITIYSGQDVGDYGSIYFADATSGNHLNRGMIRYEHNNEIMSFHTNNTQRLTIDINGNVGIGSDIPGEKLDVNGAIRSVGNNTDIYSATLKANYNAEHTLALTVNQNNSTAQEVIGTYADSGGANPRVAIAATSGWKVGINSTAPDASLDVHKVNGTIARFGDISAAVEEGLLIKNDVSTYPAITNGDSTRTIALRAAGSIQMEIDSNNNDTAKYFRVTKNGTGANGTELFRVQEDSAVIAYNGIETVSIDATAGSGILKIGKGYLESRGFNYVGNPFNVTEYGTPVNIQPIFKGNYIPVEGEIVTVTLSEDGKETRTFYFEYVLAANATGFNGTGFNNQCTISNLPAGVPEEYNQITTGGNGTWRFSNTALGGYSTNFETHAYNYYTNNAGAGNATASSFKIKIGTVLSIESAVGIGTAIPTDAVTDQGSLLAVAGIVTATEYYGTFKGNIDAAVGVTTAADKVMIQQVASDTWRQIVLTDNNTSTYDDLFIEAESGHFAYNTSKNCFHVDKIRTNITTSRDVASTAAADNQFHGSNTVVNTALAGYGDNSGGVILALGHSRKATVGDIGEAVIDDDHLGDIRFAGDDGTDMENTACQIIGAVDGTVGNDSIPGRFEFYCWDGTQNKERLRITSTGAICFGNSDNSASGYGNANQVLTSNGNGGPTWQNIPSQSGTTYTLPTFGTTNGSSGLTLTGSDGTNDDVNITGTGGITVVGNATNDTITIDGSGTPNDDTTYDLSVPNNTTDIRLAGSDGTNDDITITGGTNITVTRNSSTELSIDLNAQTTVTNAQNLQISEDEGESGTNYIWFGDSSTQSAYDALRIDKDGLVYMDAKFGIGTNSPDKRLHVAGNSYIEGEIKNPPMRADQRCVIGPFANLGSSGSALFYYQPSVTATGSYEKTVGDIITFTFSESGKETRTFSFEFVNSTSPAAGQCYSINSNYNTTSGAAYYFNMTSLSGVTNDFFFNAYAYYSYSANTFKIQVGGTLTVNNDIASLVGIGTDYIQDAVTDQEARLAVAGIVTAHQYYGSGTKLIGNAYGNRYVQTTDPVSGNTVLDGDIWYDTSASGTSSYPNPFLTSGNTQLFGSDTSDGSDTKAIMINGGGATSDTRGGYLLVHGNEHATLPGVTRLHAGNVSTGTIDFYTAGSERLRILNDGDLSVNNRAVIDDSIGTRYVIAGDFDNGTTYQISGTTVGMTISNPQHNIRGTFIPKDGESIKFTFKQRHVSGTYFENRTFIWQYDANTDTPGSGKCALINITNYNELSNDTTKKWVWNYTAQSGGYSTNFETDGRNYYGNGDGGAPLMGSGLSIEVGETELSTFTGLLLEKMSGGDVDDIDSHKIGFKTQSGVISEIQAVSKGLGGPAGRGGDLVFRIKSNNVSTPTDKLVLRESGEVVIYKQDVATSTGATPKLKFNIKQTNDQESCAGMINAIGTANWGGDLEFWTKQNNGTPNESLRHTCKMEGSSNVTYFYGDVKFDGAATTTDQNLGIHWTGFDKEGEADYTDNAEISHCVNVGGFAGSVVKVRCSNDADDGIYLDANGGTNINNKLRMNSSNIQPYTGENNGIKWPTDPWGGTGDMARICYYLDGINENARLRIQIANDNDDDLYLESQNVRAQGSFSKLGGSFLIPHPNTSAGISTTHNLAHSFIEGPQMDLIYRGKINLVDGTATINIDTKAKMAEGTFVILCKDIQCFTSNESGWGAVKGSVSGNILTITAQDNSSTDTISWMVVGERQDPTAKSLKMTDDDGEFIVQPPKDNFELYGSQPPLPSMNGAQQIT